MSPAMAFPTDHQLELVVAAAECGGITAAAERLSVSQPAVTAQIGAAERAFGTKLFTRSGGALRPTESGKLVIAFAHRQGALKRSLSASLAQLVMGETGTLIVGGSTTPSEYYLPEWLKAFRRAWPRVDVRVWIANSHDTLARLSNGMVDVAVVGDRPISEDLRAEVIATDLIVLFAAVGSPYARRRVLPAQLAEATFVVREEGSATRDFGLAELRKLGVAARRIMPLSSNEAVGRMVEAGIGIGMLSQRAVRRQVAEGRVAILKVQGWRCRRAIYLAKRRDADNVLTDAFWRVVRKAAKCSRR